jgi:hypothetical protein
MIEVILLGRRQTEEWIIQETGINRKPKILTGTDQIVELVGKVIQEINTGKIHIQKSHIEKDQEMRI